MPPASPGRRKPKQDSPLAETGALSSPKAVPLLDHTFKTPEEIAKSESESGEAATRGKATVKAHSISEPKPKKWLRIFPKKPTKKQFIIGGGILLVLIGGGTTWFLTRPKHTTPVVAKHTTPKTVVKTPVVIYSTLTGLPVADASVNKKPVTGVMIENSVDARPQSGLEQAGVVFEAVAEGGVTRFLALYQDSSPDNVGPIRSARPYYVSWAMGFDAAYAHVGGSPDALADITAWGVHDMNQFYNGNSYHRVSSRAAPHNVYTSISTLNQLEATKGYTSTYTGFTRSKPSVTKTSTNSSKSTTGADTTTTTAPAAASIDFSLSGAVYNPHYDYVPTTNSYNRSEGGSPHLDAESGKQISPKVVIAMVVPLARGALDSSGAYYSNYTTVGSGQVYVFQNGTVTTGQWSKTSNNAQITFTGSDGQAIPLLPGQTWITAVSAANQVNYK
jgi:hypothetical protein